MTFTIPEEIASQFVRRVLAGYRSRYLVASGQQIGSNYDPTGNNTQGRVTVVFRGNWAQATDLARSNVRALELVEVA